MPKPPDGFVLEPAAVEKIRANAEKGDARSQLALGFGYLTGQFVPLDNAEAANWLQKVAGQNLQGEEQKFAAACYADLGYCFLYGYFGVATNYTEAVKWFRKAAENGFADARFEFTLGGCYYYGDGVATNYTEAVRWYRKAADQGDAEAQNNLGWCYSNGLGVSKDLAEAAKWYQKAAEQGNVNAQFILGNRYYNGKGVATNYTEAARWYRKAADQGDADAQCILGDCYYYGEGVATNYTEAVRWYQKAAEQGNVDAQFMLGNRYYYGEGVATNYTEAARWYRKAADQGDAGSQNSLGFSYVLGDGVPKDYVEAYKWFNLASAQGDEIAKEGLSGIEQSMTPEQVAAGQQLAREFKPRKAPESGSSVSREGIIDSSPVASGTGFFITDDGYLITNEHVVKDAVQVRLVTSAGFISAKAVKVDAANDLALLKAEGKFSPLPITSSRAVHLGNTVATIGFPNVGLQGFAPKFARGEIAALSGAADDARYFQISVPVQPGNSGGALVDEHGNVVGVVSAKLSAVAALKTSGALPENVNYAVKSSFLLSFLESVPEVSAKLKEPNTKERKSDDVVKDAEQAAVLVLVY